MNSSTRWLVVLGSLAALTLASATADAQRVQRFDDQAGGEPSGVVLPGAPAPEQPEPEVQYVEADGGGEQEASQGDDAPSITSYNITMHGGGPVQRRRAASEFLHRDPAELYRGIIPGKRDEVSHLKQSRESGQQSGQPTPITWLGFMAEEDRTRVFVQSPRPVQYQIRADQESHKVVVTFSGARIADRNFGRFIDTSHFQRTVRRIEAREVSDGSVEMTLTLNANVRPSTSTDGDYLYLDFPHDGGEQQSASDSN